DGRAHKCTLCYDRLKGGLEPACAKSCPTNSIQFGEVEQLQEQARRRVEELHSTGRNEAYLYGAPGGPGATGGIEALHAFFLLLDKPEVYNLPQSPSLPRSRVKKSLAVGMATAAGIGMAAALVLAGSRKE
ncbi:MAG TPA: 4Fe-4S dicluster domain-containing protein, partial [Dissulfurispiraceae bacterium]